MWKVQPEAEYQKRTRAWPKKHRREFVAVHDNLDTYLKALNGGAKIEQIKFGFMHPEPRNSGNRSKRRWGWPQADSALYLPTQDI